MPEGGGRFGVWLAVGACPAGAAVAEVGGLVEGDRAAGLLAGWWCRGKEGWPASAEEAARGD